jgi:hypothetical protein
MSGLTFAKLRGNVRVVDGDGKERTVLLLQNDPIPENLAEGQLEKLQRFGAVGRGKAPDPSEAFVNAQTDTTKAPAGNDGSTTPAKDPKEMDATELAAFLKGGTGAKKLLELVGNDVEFAQRMVEAENLATKGSPRSTLTKGLNKVIAAPAGNDGSTT